MSDHSPSETVPNADAIGPVLGRTPSGVFILTASSGDGQETGMLASWVQQASFDPPAITVAVNILHEAGKRLPATGRNILQHIPKRLFA